MDRDTELALVTSLRAGAPAAFDAVYQEFNDRLLTFGPRFNGLFDEGRRSVTVEPEAPSSDVRSGATSAPLSAPEPRAVEPPGPAVGGSVASPMPDDIPADLPPPSLGAERKPACTEPWKSLYILRRGVFPRCYGGEPDRRPDCWADRADAGPGARHVNARRRTERRTARQRSRGMSVAAPR